MTEEISSEILPLHGQESPDPPFCHLASIWSIYYEEAANTNTIGGFHNEPLVKTWGELGPWTLQHRFGKTQIDWLEGSPIGSDTFHQHHRHIHLTFEFRTSVWVDIGMVQQDSNLFHWDYPGYRDHGARERQRIIFYPLQKWGAVMAKRWSVFDSAQLQAQPSHRATQWQRAPRLLLSFFNTLDTYKIAQQLGLNYRQLYHSLLTHALYKNWLFTPPAQEISSVTPFLAL